MIRFLTRSPLFPYTILFLSVVGFIALAGLAAETGVVMLVYLDEAFMRRKNETGMETPRDLEAAIIDRY